MKIIDVGDIQGKYGEWLPDDMRLPDHGAIIEGDKTEIANLGTMLYKDVTVFVENDPKQGESVSDVLREMRSMPEDWIIDANANFVFVKYADRIEAALHRELTAEFWRSTRAIEEATK